MHRFFVSRDDINMGSITIGSEDALHISKVLRLRTGDSIIVCDGDESEYICSLTSVDKKRVTCSIAEKRPITSEPNVRVHLFQGYPKSAKMDMIVQKCTEIGIYSVTPVYTERVIVRNDDEKDLSGRISRWQRIAEEAAKQSGRGRIPMVNNPMEYRQALNLMNKFDISVMPYEKEDAAGLKQLLKGKNNVKDVGIFIGPEGGFSDAEACEAMEKGIKTVSLGPRILRTETAGFTCLIMVLYELDEMEAKSWKR